MVRQATHLRIVKDFDIQFYPNSFCHVIQLSRMRTVGSKGLENLYHRPQVKPRINIPIKFYCNFTANAN
jgi:hypothetical protein